MKGSSPFMMLYVTMVTKMFVEMAMEMRMEMIPDQLWNCFDTMAMFIYFWIMNMAEVNAFKTYFYPTNQI